ncbi:MAG: hypothetical protein HFG47_02410 [Lachnospiraceae bacterium]|nr:hypothetical protein [Lachnospiraceae bacterium]
MAENVAFFAKGKFMRPFGVKKNAKNSGCIQKNNKMKDWGKPGNKFYLWQKLSGFPGKSSW